MQVFKCFFRIVWKNKWTMFLYFGIILFLSLAFAGTGNETNITNFSISKVKVGIVDQDQSEISKALTEFLGNQSELVPVADTAAKRDDQIFYRELEYILFVPKDFGKDLQEGKDVVMDTQTVPGAYTTNFVDMQVNNFLNTIKAYVAGGATVEEAIQGTNKAIQSETKVELASGEIDTAENEQYAFYYRFVAYAILMIVMLGLGVVLTQFNKLDLRRRIQCSALTNNSYNIQMTLAAFVFALIVFVLLNATGIILYHSGKDFGINIPYLLLNSFGMTTVSVSIGYLFGVLVKNSNALNAAGNTVAMAMSFLGGIFVPQEFMNEGILKFAQFVPSYWYVKGLKVITAKDITQWTNQRELLMDVGMQLMFAIAFLSIAIAIRKVQSKK